MSHHFRDPAKLNWTVKSLMQKANIYHGPINDGSFDDSCIMAYKAYATQTHGVVHSTFPDYPVQPNSVKRIWEAEAGTLFEAARAGSVVVPVTKPAVVVETPAPTPVQAPIEQAVVEPEKLPTSVVMRDAPAKVTTEEDEEETEIEADEEDKPAKRRK